MAFNVEHINTLLNAMGVKGEKLPVGSHQKMGSFHLSMYECIHARNHKELAEIIQMKMRHLNMEKIWQVWRSPSDESIQFIGPVETFPKLVGMLLTRKAMKPLQPIEAKKVFIKAL
jgi:hypothetical protein